MEITYSNPNEQQYLDLRFVFKVNFTPGDKQHLTMVLKSFLESKGIKMEDESHRIEIK